MSIFRNRERYEKRRKFSQYTRDCGYSKSELLSLHQLYKSGSIQEEELINAPGLRKYLGDTWGGDIPTPSTEEPNYKKLKSRIIKRMSTYHACNYQSGPKDFLLANYFGVGPRNTNADVYVSSALDELISDIKLFFKYLRAERNPGDEVEYSQPIWVLSNIGETNLAYRIAMLVLTKINNKDGRAMYSLWNIYRGGDFLDVKIPNAKHRYFEAYRWLIRACEQGHKYAMRYMKSQFGTIDYKDVQEFHNIILTYEHAHSKLEKEKKSQDDKIKELKAQVKTLQDQVTDLTYRPGGPGFQMAQTRQIVNMKP